MINHDKTMISTTSVVLILVAVLALAGMLLFSDSGRKIIDNYMKVEDKNNSQNGVTQINENSDNASNSITYK